MKRQTLVRSSLGAVLAVGAAIIAGTVASAQTPLTIDKAKITISGTSNIHDYTATTADAKVTRVQFGADIASAAFWGAVQEPGGLAAFDLEIKAETLKSTKDGLDKNMYKALKTKEHALITFSLKRMEGEPGTLTAIGALKIAGVERDVTLPLKTVRKGDHLAVSGEIDVLMTDFGIAPPKAMMGMVKADPKITVTFDVLLALSTTN
jgi:polyisoprenoid-binding protein YceI